MTAPKSPELVALLKWLRRDLGHDAFTVRDHWEADLCATGIARVGAPGVLAYLSVFQQPTERFFLELEQPTASPYEVVGSWESIAYPELLERVRQHLGLALPRTS